MPIDSIFLGRKYRILDVLKIDEKEILATVIHKGRVTNIKEGFKTSIERDTRYEEILRDLRNSIVYGHE